MSVLQLAFEKLDRRLSQLAARLYRDSRPLEPLRYRGPEHDAWTALAPGAYWGGRGQAFTLQGEFCVPESFVSAALCLPVGHGTDGFQHPEALLYLDEVAFAGVDRNHQEITLPAAVCDGRTHALRLHGWCGIEEMQFRMGQPAVVDVHEPTRALYTAARIAHQTSGLLPDRVPARHHLLAALERAFAALDWRGDFYASVPAALTILDQALRQSGAPLSVDLVATGHAHLDVAWLWTLDQTRQKAARTFSTVLRLMEAFPEYHFTQSQPQLYAYVKEDHPPLFAQIQQRVREGRWEATGGMWLEADCNLSGAEALVRQFLLGRQFFRDNFGQADTPICWLPDAFGFNWALPQLIKQAGLEFFLTVKLSWSQQNRFPHDSFWWQGIDGTRVLVHCPTTPDSWSPRPTRKLYTYNGSLEPNKLLGAWDNYRHKEAHQELLILFGHGDGGGGPTREMLLAGRQQADHPLLPRVRQGSALEFFQRLRDSAGDKLPVWNDELYLEYHRGTYTSQAAVKRANRQNEIALHAAEFLAAWALAHDPGFRYPHAELRRAWELLCLNQFHDILPGSSIGAVYAESLQQHAEITRLAQSMLGAALQAFTALTGDWLIFNPTAFARREPVFVPDRQLANGQGVNGGTLVEAGLIPPYGCLAVNRADLSLPANTLTVTQSAAGWTLANEQVAATFNPAGDLVRVFDQQAGREVLAPGEIGNQLQAFDDRPLNFDAWDIDPFFEETRWLAQPAHSVRIIEQGPLRAGLEIQRRILNSDVVQRVYLWRDSPRLDFQTRVTWRERQVLLKVAFPVQVLAPVATYEIQWGNIERPTHRNTSWDAARFEVPAHKWADLSEGDYGVSLLNDCKYGYDIHDHVMRLSLIKSPVDPDPLADLGAHTFTYSLLPHRGDWRTNTAAQAYALNYPLIVHAAEATTPALNAAASPLSFVWTDTPHVVVETVKQAEDGDSLIIRLYESGRTRGSVTLHSLYPLASAERCNLLEEKLAELPCEAHTVPFAIRPYEIVSLRLRLRSASGSA